jgi:hypothetical protein
METNNMNMAIFTPFFFFFSPPSLLATENLENDFFAEFRISLFEEVSPVKKRLLVGTDS